MLIPGEEHYTDMTSSEFEQFCLEHLEGVSNSIPNSIFEHNVIENTHDGDYQIDGRITFHYLGVNYLTLVECKMYKGPVSREKVQILYDKLRAIGANKGVMMTSSYFQRGAIKYAKEHGIALIKVVEGKLTYEVRATGIEDLQYPDYLPRFVGIRLNWIKDETYGSSVLTDYSYLRSFIEDN